MGNTPSNPEDPQSYKGSFPGSAVGSALLDSLPTCGSLADTTSDDSPNKGGISSLLTTAENLCSQTPTSDAGSSIQHRGTAFDAEYEEFRREGEPQPDDKTGPKVSNTPANPTAALFARALVNEVTDNPKTMTPADMAERERRLLKAQERAKHAGKGGDNSKAVGTPGGVGQPSVMGTIAHALTGSTDPLGTGDGGIAGTKKSVIPPSSFSENRAQFDSNTMVPETAPGENTVTIGLSLSRRSAIGHQSTVTRQTAFDFNELQDRDNAFISSTDAMGWRAGGGEKGGVPHSDEADANHLGSGARAGTPTGEAPKIAAADTIHIPIITIDAPSAKAVDEIVAALARGEIFIPHMAIIPEALSVDGVSPPDLVVRFGTERNDDLTPDEWPNWCLEFMHNQLYEYFHNMGARWMKRPFSITLAKKVRWKTVKHMNRYFAHAERVIDSWRERGPQHLDPQLSYIQGDAVPEEVAKPHGIYLMRGGVPTNYFAPNFEPPYTTKMTRSLLTNVLSKSWDKKAREWTSEPIPKLITPGMLVTAMCGCGDNQAGGFVANEVTLAGKIDTSTIPQEALIRSVTPKRRRQGNEQVPSTQTPDNTDPAKEDTSPHPGHAEHKSPMEKRSSPVAEARRSLSDTSSQEELHNIIGRNVVKDETTDLHIDANNEDFTGATGFSPKYGRAPTPEAKRMSKGSDPAVGSAGRMDSSNDFSAPSAAGTTSTIMHTNLATETLMNRELERRHREEKKDDDNVKENQRSSTLVSDDDWLDDFGQPLPSPAVTDFVSQQEKKKEAMETEQARKIALMAKTNELINRKSGKKAYPGIQKNNSGVSLEYSIDSTLMGDQSTFGGNSTLMGQQFAADTSVASATSTSQRPSATTRVKQETIMEGPSDATPKDDQSQFSLQESTSSVDVIPSDEDLFAIGWAKAMDPNSDSYYYFTLDRSKIVWDSPLANHGHGAESVDSSLPEGAAAI